MRSDILRTAGLGTTGTWKPGHCTQSSYRCAASGKDRPAACPALWGTSNGTLCVWGAVGRPAGDKPWDCGHLQDTHRLLWDSPICGQAIGWAPPLQGKEICFFFSKATCRRVPPSRTIIAGTPQNNTGTTHVAVQPSWGACRCLGHPGSCSPVLSGWCPGCVAAAHSAQQGCS